MSDFCSGQAASFRLRERCSRGSNPVAPTIHLVTIFPNGHAELYPCPIFVQVRRPRFDCASGAHSLNQSLLDIGDNIIHMFQTDGDADQARCDADRCPLFVTQLGVGGGGGMSDNGPGVSQVG